MNKEDEPHHRLVEALLLGESRKLDALCRRLGIETNQPDWVKYVYIGLALASDQPEFTGKPRRKGRPKKGLLQSVDVARARLIEHIQARVERDMGQRVTITKLISRVAGKTLLFPDDADHQSLLNSVSRGRAVLKKFRVESKRFGRARRAKTNARPPMD